MSTGKLEPICGCGIMGVVKCVSGMPGVLPLIHGPVSCSSGHRMAMLFAEVEPLLPTTNVTDESLVLGSVDRLADAMGKAFAAYRPALLVVITTCATALIGEDYGAVIRDYEASTGAAAIQVDGSALSGDEIDAAYETYSAITRRMGLERAPSPAGPAVVLEGIARTDYGYEKNRPVLRHLVEQCAGCRLEDGLFSGVDLAGETATYQSARRLYAASLWQSENAQVPPAPFGVEGTAGFVNAVAGWCGQSAAPSGRQEYEAAKAALEPLAAELKQSPRTVGVEAAGWYGYALASYLKNELGCKVLLSVDRANPSIPPESVCDAFYEDVGRFELVTLMMEFGCRTVFGSSNTQLDEEWTYVPFFQPVWRAVELPQSLMGYDGAIRIARTLLEADA